MPVVASEDSRSASSGNESNNEDAHNDFGRPRSPDTSPGHPRSPTSGPQSPESPRSGSGSPASSRSRSQSPTSPVNNSANGPHNTERPSSPDSHRSRSASSASSNGRSFSQESGHNSRPESPKSDGRQSAVASRDSSPTQKKDSGSDNGSVKSPKSPPATRKSRSRTSSRSSSRESRRRSGSDSDSSVSSIDSSSRKNKDINRSADTKPEDISDGDMESDQEKRASPKAKPAENLNISHEDLSDVSDLEDSMGGNSEGELEERKDLTDDATKKSESESIDDQKQDKKTEASHDDNEEQLDFEAEDGECDDVKSKDGDKEDGEEEKEPEKVKEEKELEEGEVTDEDDARPEETEPRPVCRFFSRGACTWGASCRFLHPGVTDKGNYTMFDMVRPMLPGEYSMGRMEDRYKLEPTLIESAWERGLRTAKEMLKKSMRRKEQDIDFEEKKMNLSIAQEEFDKENGYYGRIPSPEPRYVRHLPEYGVPRPPPPPPEDYYGRRPAVYEPDYPPQRREHSRPYGEMPPSRRPPHPEYYGSKYEDDVAPRPHDRGNVEVRGDRERDRERRKPKREVIVQRAEKDGRPSRGDEWQDPWMRSKSPGRKRERKASYSSNSSSYSSSSSRSSTGSSKSSYRSRSRSPYKKERSRSRPRGTRQVSPSVIVSERKAANERAALMNPPAPKRRAPSPGMMRVSAAANPPAPTREDRSRKLAVAAALARAKGKRRTSRSSSGSSSGSSSDSDSSESSSDSSLHSGSPQPRKPSDFAKAIDALKGGSSISDKTKIKLNLKNPNSTRKPTEATERKPDAKKRPASSPPLSDAKTKKATSRREELLKQLKAVEDAIAKKRSKV